MNNLNHWLRYAIASLVAVLVLGSCSSPDGGPPAWVQSPPKHLSCHGTTDPQLMVDLIRAAKLGNPNPEDSHAEVVESEASATCYAVGENKLELSIDPAENLYMASGYSPPDPLLVPIGKLPGFVTHDYARLYVPCTRNSKTMTLKSAIGISPTVDPPKRRNNLRNPRARLAMARLAVNLTKNARERFGCSEAPLPMPTDLPPIPKIGPPSEEDTNSGPNADRICDPRAVVNLPEYDPSGDRRPWAMKTPEPSGLISTCEIRVGDGMYTEDVPGAPKMAFVTYKGVLAQARQDSAKYALPRYDITCHGEPVSYRLYVPKSSGGFEWSKQLPSDPAYQQLQEGWAKAAAQRSGCSLKAK